MSKLTLSVSGKIRVAIAGVGNAASALVQGISYYFQDETRSGLWHPTVGNYRISDIEIVAAYDIDPRKIGLDLGRAIFTKPNVILKYSNVKSLGIEVEAGLIGDDLPPALAGDIPSADKISITDSLKAKKPDILLNLISSGRDSASRKYAESALDTCCSFVNATPSHLADNEELVAKYSDAGALILGDDLMSQFGGTVFHKGILDFMVGRGIKLKKSYQLDVGGGSETLNTLSEDLRAVKRKVKTEAIGGEVPYSIQSVAGTTDYVDFMGNSRTSYFWIEGEQFLGAPVKFDIYLRTNDGPNAAGILVDIIRATKTAMDKGGKGTDHTISAYGFKRPPKLQKLSQAYEEFRRNYL